jgi:lipopolysaccharide transport system ATP-binding protein
MTIALNAVTKSYTLYRSPVSQLADALGFGWSARRRPRHDVFTALDSISLKIGNGERVGIVGRNGAGKTTLLKLITGITEPTEGTISITGTVQALLHVGMGFHPEMTGLENIRGALIYNGLSGEELRFATDDVIDFAELGEFLERPLKTYSLGMRSRLQFATATAIKPSILIVDEILGAGDAYFAVKSAERMRRLTFGGCTLVLVSHSMPQLHQFCARVVWMERGKIVADGAPLTVINAYEEFIARYHMEAVRGDAAGEKGGLPSWLSEKLAREALGSAELTSLTGASTALKSKEGSRWGGPGPLRIKDIQLLDASKQPTSRLEESVAFGIAVDIASDSKGTFCCSTIVFIYHENGHVITRAFNTEDELHLEDGQTTRRIAWFDHNFLGNGRYMISAGLYRVFDPVVPGAAERYDILSKTASFDVVATPNDPSLIRVEPTWLLA